MGFERLSRRRRRPPTRCHPMDGAERQIQPMRCGSKAPFSILVKREISQTSPAAPTVVRPRYLLGTRSRHRRRARRSSVPLVAAVGDAVAGRSFHACGRPGSRGSAALTVVRGTRAARPRGLEGGGRVHRRAARLGAGGAARPRRAALPGRWRARVADTPGRPWRAAPLPFHRLPARAHRKWSTAPSPFGPLTREEGEQPPHLRRATGDTRFHPLARGVPRRQWEVYTDGCQRGGRRRRW